MTDEELLDSAAKAVGYVLLSNGQACSQDTGNFDWNPLSDDGDALRLAVKCNLNVCVGYASVSACLQDDGSFLRTVEIKEDPYSATRLAIVRAAAAIGESTRAKP